MNENAIQGYCQACCYTPNPPWQCSYSELSCADCSAVPLTDFLPVLIIAGILLAIKTLIK